MSKELEAEAPAITNESAAATNESVAIETPKIIEASKEAPVPEAKIDAVEVENVETTKPEGSLTVVPEQYDIKLPEGSRLNPEQINEIAAYAKDKGLSNDQAQMIADRESLALATYADSQMSLLKKTSEVWYHELQKDKDFGGAAFEKNAKLTKDFVTKYFNPEFKKVLDDTGLSNHPELVRGLFKMAKAAEPDKAVIPKSKSGISSREKLEQVFYGNSNKGEA